MNLKPGGFTEKPPSQLVLRRPTFEAVSMTSNPVIRRLQSLASSRILRPVLAKWPLSVSIVLGLLAILILRGVEIHISDIHIRLGR